MYIFYLFKYDIIHVYSSKYIKRMQDFNYINVFNYLNRVVHFDVVLYLHVPGIIAKHLCASINCNCSNSRIKQNILNLQ